MYVGIDIQKTYRAGIGISYIHTQGLSTNLRCTYLGPPYKKKSMYVGIDIVQGNEMGHRN